MSRRSTIATRRRRKARRNGKQIQLEVSRSIRDHGDPTADPRFDRPTTTPCQDCNLENRLRSTDLRASPIGAIPLQPSRLSKWRPVASAGCETCEGTGHVPIPKEDQVDPYDLVARKESREALESLQLWRLRGDTPARTTSTRA